MRVLLDQSELITESTSITLDELPGGLVRVVEGELAESVIFLVQHGGDVEDLLAGVQDAVALQVAGHAVDDVSQGLAGSAVVGVVVDDALGDDGAVGAERLETLVPVDVAGEVGVNVVLEQEGLEGVADVALVRGSLGGVHGTMAHGNDPGGLLAVDGGKVLCEPLVLLVSLGVLVLVVVDLAEGARIGDKGLVLRGQDVLAADITDERPFGGVGEVGLTVNGDEVRETIVERVPEVANTASLSTRHAETVDVGGEVSVSMR